MKKVIVTGGAGYIGSHTVVELQQAGFDVVIIDNLSNSSIEALDGIERITGIRPQFENLDLIDYLGLDNLLKKHKGAKTIIHFAACKAVGESVQKPLLYYRNNLISLMNILQLMPLHGIENIVFSSSCTVYGQPDELPVSEAAPIKLALSPYGNTKQICEEIIRDTLYANMGLKSIVLRYFNPIGAHPSALIGEFSKDVPNNLVPFITQTAMGFRKQLHVFGNDYNTPDGSCIRDYINVVDVAKAHVMAMKRLIKGKVLDRLELFNLGTGQGISTLEMIKIFKKVNQIDVPYKIVDRRDGDIEKVWANSEKANKVLGWRSEVTIEDSLRSAWAWEISLSKKGLYPKY